MLMISKSLLHNQTGSIAVFVMLLISVYLAVATAMFEVERASYTDSMNTLQVAQAEYLAQTAVQEGKYYHDNVQSGWTGSSSEQSLTLDGVTIGTYEYSIEKAGNKFTITGVGYLPNKTSSTLTNTQKLVFYNPAPQILFSDDFENGNLDKWSGESNDSDTDWDIDNEDPLNGSWHLRARSWNDNSNKYMRLMTPTFNLTGYEKVVIRFSHRRKNYTDWLKVYRNSTGQDNGWVQIFYVNNQSRSSYEKPAERIEITDTFGASEQFRFEVRADENEEWFIDDVVISTPYVLWDATVDSN